MSGDWAARAGTVEEVIRRRFVRRLAGLVPGTRIGRVRWPRPLLIRPWPWHYWWQAHLLDCLVDAQRRAPQPWRAVEIAALARTVRLRNLGSWTNRYYDDIAWFGLAVQRAGPLARRSTQPALAAITARLRAGWTPAGGGGIWWRRGDDFKNAPANGPAAILAARAGDLDFATTITDWIAATLVDPQTGLVRDGVRLNPDGTIRTVEATTYTYCQGVYLGACVELAERDGHPRWAERAATVLHARHRHGRTGRGDPGLRRRRRRRAVQRHPGPLPRRHRGPTPRAHRARRPARAGQRRRGLAGPHSTWTTPPTAARCSPPTGADRPAPRDRGSPKPTCRYSCRHGCSWKPPPEQPAPSPRRRPPIRPDTGGPTGM